MKNTIDISRFGKFFTMELRQYRKLFLILMGITLIDLIMSMATFSASYKMVAHADMDALNIDNATIANMIYQAKLGVNPFKLGGAFGFLMLIVPFLMYNFVYHPTKSLTYSMLPASWLEKFASAWLMCVVVVPLLLFGFSLLIAFLGDLVGAQISYHDLSFNSFFTKFYLPTICIQAIAFWGVFWFKRQKVGKTILTIVIVLIGLGVVLSQLPLLKMVNYSINMNTTYLLYSVYGLMIALWTLALIKFPRTQI